MDSSAVSYISEWYVKPENMPEESKLAYYLTPWDLAMVSTQYIQKGFLFAKPQQQDFIQILLEKLKHSLSLALVHFYPLAGRLATLKEQDPPSYCIYIDCNNSHGAKLIYATAMDIKVSDIMSPTYVPYALVQSFFDHHRAANHDGHTLPLLSIQVTELVDGVFIGPSMNHVVGDGSSFWHFLNSLSEIYQSLGSDAILISRPPVLKRWFPPGHGPILNLPFSSPDDFVSRYESPQLKERFFMFSSESIKRLKAIANSDCSTDTISSFQALSALMWRCITRARGLPNDQVTKCRLAANDRSRLQPPLSPEYFGCSISAVCGIATAGELLEHNIGWAALKLHEAVVNHSDNAIRSTLDEWFRSPYVYEIGRFFDPMSVMMGSSPKFNKYGPEFGMGKALTLRSGYAHKFDGKVSAYPGREGGGSIDLEVCLLPQFMTAIELDTEFISALG